MTAVHGDAFAGDKGSLVGSQKRDRRGDVSRSSHTRDGLLRLPGSLNVGPVRAVTLDEVGNGYFIGDVCRKRRRVFAASSDGICGRGGSLLSEVVDGDRPAV